MSEDLKVFGKTYSGVTGIQVKDTDGLNLLFQKSIDEDVEIIVLSENLHDSSEDVANTYINGSTETSYNGWTSTGYIPVKPDTYYKVANTPGNNYNAFYKSDKTVAKGGIVVPQSTTTDPVVLIKTTSNTSYIRMSGASSVVANYEIYEANVVEVGSYSSGYDINSGNLVTLFDQYAEENDMEVMELTFTSDQTENFTINHSLGKVPVEALLYPKNIVRNGGGYQIGWVTNGFWAKDNMGNRTIMVKTGYSPNDTTLIWYPTAKNLTSLLGGFTVTDYNFTQSEPTSTTATFRGGTRNDTKLLAGEYKLALR